MHVTDKSGSWVVTVVESTGSIGYFSDIAIDSNDKIHISYLDYTNNDLKYATDKSGSWATSTLDSTGIVGDYSSIIIDSGDKVSSVFEEVFN